MSLIELGEARIVSLGPQIDEAENPTFQWGFHQFPDMWRAAGGEIYLCVNMGFDDQIGRHDPSKWFRSDDGGADYREVRPEEVDLKPATWTLPDGRQLMVGDQQFVYHWSTYGPGRIVRSMFPRKHGVKSVCEPWHRKYGQAWMETYRLGDFPVEARLFPVRFRASADGPWQEGTAFVDAPELLLDAIIKTRTWMDKERRDEFVGVEPEIDSTFYCPVQLTVLDDGAVIACMQSHNPAVLGRPYRQANCIASTDGGRTWHLRAVIADQTDLTTNGYAATEYSIAIMPDGDLLWVCRTDTAVTWADSRHLVARRSSDGGFTWSAPEKIGEFSVTPHLLSLENGHVAVVYGRPGVHVKASGDGGRTWTEAVNIVGPEEKAYLSSPPQDRADPFIYSCANTDVVVTGPDRFLLAYTDFFHAHPDGGRCKAVIVRELIVGG